MKARAAGSGGTTKRPSSGRPPKAAPAPAASFDGISQILAAVKNSEQQRVQLRGALERIQTIIRDALA